MVAAVVVSNTNGVTPVETPVAPTMAKVWPKSRCTVVPALPEKFRPLLLLAVMALYAEYNCEPLMPSVLLAATLPAATYLSWRSFVAEPTLTTPFNVEPWPAKAYAVPFNVIPVSLVATLSVEALPKMTLLSWVD